MKKYNIKIIDAKEFEFDFINCDTCKIFKDGFLIGRYNFNENKFEADNFWGAKVLDFEQLTPRQQKLVLINANKYFYNMYSKIYFQLLKQGEFFAPTDENEQRQLYYIKSINKIKNNINILKNIDNSIKQC